MARCLRIDRGGIAYHVLNRRVGRLPLFEKHEDYVAFEKVLDEAYAKTPMRVISYCLMPNHWHLVLWPTCDGQTSRYMQWLTTTHMRRRHAHRDGWHGQASSTIGCHKAPPFYRRRHRLWRKMELGHVYAVRKRAAP
ncbi:MAG: transposase, partial [Phycisphaerae bacterium]|nr:transposase [Phycisphaerae bacterium]